MIINPQLLIEETYNFYGLKASLAAATEFIKQFGSATPGSFYDWVHKAEKSSSLW